MNRTPTSTSFGVHRSAFTLVELLVVIAIIGLLIAILMPALASARTTALRMESNTRLRSMQQGFSMWASENRGAYPGIKPDGVLTDENDVTYPGWLRGSGRTRTGDYPGLRFGLLIHYEYIDSSYTISPFEVSTRLGPMTSWHEGSPSWASRASYSYAILAIAHSSEEIGLDMSGLTPFGWRERRMAWSSAENNAHTPTISDRALGVNSSTEGRPDSNTISSLHTPFRSGEWRGGIAFADGRVIFNDTHVVATRIDNVYNPNDSLFTPVTIAQGPPSLPGAKLNNAVMCWSQPDRYIDHFTGVTE